MTIPRQVKVGPHTYRIITDPEAIRKVSAENGDPDGEWAAFSNHEDQIIGINREHHPQAQAMELAHEILHCCLRVAGVWPNEFSAIHSRSTRRHESGYTVEEFTVAAIAPLLVAVLRDNPSVSEFLQHPERKAK